jgi:hypothetical protein
VQSASAITCRLKFLWACSVLVRRDFSLLDTLDFEMHPLAQVKSMPKTGGKQFARLLRASRLDTPLLHTSYHH